MNARISSLRNYIVENNLDAVLISGSVNRRYLSGFTGSAGFLFISRSEAVLATDFRYTEQANSEAPDFEVIRIDGGFSGWMPGLISERGVKRLGFENEDLSLAVYRRMVTACRNLAPRLRPELKGISGAVESIRETKDSEEISKMEEAAKLADAAVTRAWESIRPGKTERELAWELEKYMRERGSESLPFEIIVASGPNSAMPHARPTDRNIGECEPIVIDLGAKIDGYSSDLTRTLYLGRPDETFKKVYGTVLRAQSVAMESIKSGMRGSEVDSKAREVITEAGYGENFGHGLGHGVGLESHERPGLGPNSVDILKPGMVFTIEPGIYIPGWGGVRIEDMILWGGEEPRFITRAQKKRFVED
ncbi:MAG: aminopeptidase P family protein [Dehalococcoidia bacterium]